MVRYLATPEPGSTQEQRAAAALRGPGRAEPRPRDAGAAARARRGDARRDLSWKVRYRTLL